MSLDTFFLLGNIWHSLNRYNNDVQEVGTSEIPLPLPYRPCKKTSGEGDMRDHSYLIRWVCLNSYGDSMTRYIYVCYGSSRGFWNVSCLDTGHDNYGYCKCTGWFGAQPSGRLIDYLRYTMVQITSVRVSFSRHIHLSLLWQGGTQKIYNKIN